MRRIVAIVLPQLACEIARRKRVESGNGEGVPWAPFHDGAASGPKPPAPWAPSGPIAVLLDRDGATPVAAETARIDAVEDEARRYGVRPGQRVTEAAALLAGLAVCHVTHGEIDAALGRVAEVALGFGPTAALQLREAPQGAPRSPWGDAPFDTVWLDATGSAHLAGGEEALLAELEERLGALGHRARLSIAGGPRLAQALARWAPGLRGSPGARGRYPLVPTPPEAAAAALAPLPLSAMPLEPEIASFFLRLGVFTVGDLARLPRPAARARLGARAAEILDLTAGRDDTPLLPYAPPREIVEETTFEEGVESAEALLFVLRGMASRAAVRLLARGEACSRVEAAFALDRSIARLRGGEEAAIEAGFHVDLPAPLSDEGDLLRTLRAKLDRFDLPAPAVNARLRLAQIVPAPEVQLDLSRGRAADPDALPALLAELSAEIGEGSVGLLSLQDAHRPEAQSRLVPPILAGSKPHKGPSEQLTFGDAMGERRDPIPPPTRILPVPIPLGKVAKGGVVAIGSSPRGPGGDPQIFAVEKLEFLVRLDAVEWWTRSPTSRDYARAWLVSGGDERGARGKAKAACAEALVYVQRKTGEVFLQGWYE